MEPILIVEGKVRRPTITNMLKALTSVNHELITTFISGLESIYAPSHVDSITRETLRYMVRLQNGGIGNVLDSTNKDIVAHCQSIESESEAVRQHRIGCLRIFLHFLSVEHRLSSTLEMTANIFMYDRIIFIGKLPGRKRDAFEAASKCGKRVPIARGQYRGYACRPCDLVDDLDYSHTTKCVLSRALRCFYVFLCANDLDYAPTLADHWIKESVASELVGRASYRRAFALLDHYMENGHLDPVAVYHRGKNDDALPLWCSDPLDEHLLMKERDGQAASSVRMQRACNLRFCNYILSYGIAGWDELTPRIVMGFHVQDAHSTAESKNAYNSRVRRFIGFLAEGGHVPETLALALLSSKAERTAIVEVFTDAELAQMELSKSKATGPIDLRSICIVLLGLRLGIRSNDIVSLRLTDICWQKQEIKVAQSKTAAVLTLPMPVEAANCLHRYILEGRPGTSSPFIFVRHHAPFCKLCRSACGAALARVLENGDARIVGFHITRKTFASRMLVSAVPVDTIADVLGHTTNITVHRYLPTDEAGLRNCAIPLSAVPLREGAVSV